MDSADAIRRIRESLQLLREGEELKKRINVDPSIDNVAEISKLVARSTELDREYDEMNQQPNAAEVFVGTAVGKLNYELLGPIVQRLGSSAFSAHDYALAINRKVSAEGNQNWDIIADIASRISKTTKFSSCLLGSFDNIPIPKTVNRERKKTTKATLGKEEKLETVKKLDKKDKGAMKVNETFKQIIQIYRKAQQPIPYYKLVIDPENFMCTIANAFDISFLVRDGILIVDKDDDDMPTVRLPTAAERKVAVNDTAFQAISRFNMNFIQKMIRKYHIEEPMLTVNREEENFYSQASTSSQNER